MEKVACSCYMYVKDTTTVKYAPHGQPYRSRIVSRDRSTSQFASLFIRVDLIPSPSEVLAVDLSHLVLLAIVKKV